MQTGPNQPPDGGSAQPPTPWAGTPMPPPGQPGGPPSGPPYQPGPPAPTFPGGYPGGGPPRPQRSRAFVPLLVVGAVTALAAAVGMVVVVVHLASGHDTHPPQRAAGGSSAASASASPSPSPSPTAPPGYDTLPDPCSLGHSRPALAAGIKANRGSAGDPDSKECQFGRYHSDQAEHLEVTLTLAPGDGGPDATHRTLADDKKYAADTNENGGYRKKPSALKGVGDEGFACHLLDPVVYGKSEQDAKNYNIAGAIVEVRARNVLVEVDWAATPHFTSTDGRSLTGPYIGYQKARRQALVVLKYLLGKLR